MFTILEKTLSEFGMSEVMSILLSAFILATLMMSLSLVIGVVVNKINILLIRLASKLTGVNLAIFIINRILFPGTIIHELSHALLATLTGAKVVKIRCLTLFSKDTLGYVEFAPRGNKIKQAIQMTMVSCAPVMVGIVFLYVSTKILTAQMSVGNTPFILIYLMISVFCHMSMSNTDITMYKKGILYVIPLLTAIMFIIRYLFT